MFKVKYVMGKFCGKLIFRGKKCTKNKPQVFSCIPYTLANFYRKKIVYLGAAADGRRHAQLAAQLDRDLLLDLLGSIQYIS
jgi:hypothetical protein